MNLTSLVKELQEDYKKKKYEILSRLEEFKRNNIFDELFFCLLTPQAKAKLCWSAILNLKKKNLLHKGSCKEIEKYLYGVRFKKKKSKYIILARKKVNDIKTFISDKKYSDIFSLREWLVKNIKGFGYKEASHFLRNIGLGKNIAILDRHILKNLTTYGVIENIPKNLSPRKYVEIENKMREFSKNVNIPMEHLDLLFWSKETGEIFK